MKIFPDAFRFQYEDRQGSLNKLKFTPNPNFHPSGYLAQVFRHMEGSLLVDGQQKRLAQINGYGAVGLLVMSSLWNTWPRRPHSGGGQAVPIAIEEIQTRGTL
jgi:hypothetical protein